MELGENLISNRSVRPTDGGLPWYSASGGSWAATVKVLGDVAERY
jgi:hypothetical protein